MLTCLVGQQFYVGHRFWTGKCLFQRPLHKHPRLLVLSEFAVTGTGQCVMPLYGGGRFGSEVVLK
jgi:hypothetical protein